MRDSHARPAAPWKQATWLPVALSAGSLLLLGCGSGGSVTTPTPPPAAVLAVQIQGVETAPSPVAGSRFRTTVSTRVLETAGFGANINFVQLRFLEEVGDDDALEVVSLGADALLEQTGSNRIEGRSSRELTLSFDHDTDINTTAEELVFDFTDDAGNESQRAFPIPF